MTAPTPRLGIDVGGTKIEVAVLDADGRIRARQRRPTPQGDYRGTIAAIALLVRDVEKDLGVRCSIGMGIPGSISSRTGLVRNANSTCLNGQPFHDDVSRALHRLVRCENDANCFAVSEANDGAGAGHRVVFAAIIGTGCGAGLTVDHRVHTGRNGVAGEWGHTQLPGLTDADTLPERCYCGRSNCLELYVSGSGLERDHALRAAPLSAGEIVERSAHGETSSEGAVERYEARLARGLAVVVNTVDPDVIVLGGGMSNVSRLYDHLPVLIAPHVFGNEFDTPIVPAIHGDSSGVRGAAWLWSLEEASAAATPIT